MNESTRNKGSYGEELAKKFLLKKGYIILEENYHFGHGELDLIAKDGETIVFVEVKYRKSLEYGRPEYSVTKQKQAQIKKIAQAWLYEREITDTECRIDVIAIYRDEKNRFNTNHYENAF